MLPKIENQKEGDINMTNEEKILEALEKMDQRQTRTEEMLEKMDQRQTRAEEMLEKHNEMLAKHGEMLEKHGEALDKHSELLAEMHSTLTKIAVTQENIVLPQLKLLAEGHDTLLETLAPKDRTEKLEEEVEFLKVVVRSLSKEVAELKKAQ